MTPRYTATSWAVWGTTAQLVVAVDSAGSAATRLVRARDIATATLVEVDVAASRFRGDSDLSRVNAQSGSWVPVGAVFVDMLRAAIRAAQVSGGLVDPTVGGALQRAGYVADLTELDLVSADPVSADLASADLASVAVPVFTVTTPSGADRPTWQGIDLIAGRGHRPAQVRVPAGVSLDLGAVGKAYAADVIADRLGRAGVDAVVSLGGDVAVTPGPRTHQWRVDVSERPGTPAEQSLVVTSGALATSTTTHRRWRTEGQVAHHIIDPRTQAPAMEVWRTVTVAAASAVDANTASTAAVVLGAAAHDWLRGHQLAARLVAVDGEVTTTCGWPGPAGHTGLITETDTGSDIATDEADRVGGRR